MPKDCLAVVLHRAGGWSPSKKKRVRCRWWSRWCTRERAIATEHCDKTVLPSGGSSSSLKVQNFRYGRLNVLRWLLWEAEMPALERSNNGALALHYAAARGCLDCVKLLVESSTELSANTQMDNDVTPVYLAAQEGHLEVLKFLVTEAGGSLYVRAKDGMAPVHAAAQMGCLSCLKWMVQEQGVDPNLRDGDGATPLHFAASRGHVETVRWLLRHGARLVLDKFGKSPINDAAENQQIECLNILVQHGATPDYPEARHKPAGCSCCKGESQEKCSEPFFLHPPPIQHQQPDGLYINPAHNSANDPFYLHNPHDLVYNRVKDLFETPSSSQPAAPTLSGLSVKVGVHSSSSGAGSDENLSSLDLSERSADPENDYEEIYHPREEKTTVTGVRRSSRDSGSHSRSSSSSNSHVVVEAAPTPRQNAAPAQEDPSMTASTGKIVGQEDAETTECQFSNCADLEPVSLLDSIISSFEEQEESGVSSGSPSDLCHSEEECEKTRVSHRHSLPHLLHSSGSSRALKRVVSEPGPMCPPPPPPPPPEEEGFSSPSRSSSPKDTEVLEEPTVKPSEVVQREDAVKRPGSPSAVPSVSEDGDEQRPSPNLVNKQMVLPFIPPRFPSTAADSNSLIKPSEYLRSLGGSRQKSPDEPPITNKTETLPVTVASAPSGPPPPPLPAKDNISPTTARKQQQPLGAISIQDLNSVQLRRTDKMMAAKTLSAPPRHTVGDQPFLLQKEDLIAELKMSKDITGIKKLKVERARVEEQQEKQMFTEITRQLTANSFVEKIPEKDATGNPIPAWKRQMMAKKAAERARKELEDQMLKEAEQKRLQAIPPWKRQLLAKKEEHESRKTNLYTPRVVDDKKAKPLKPEEVLRQQLPSSSEVVPTLEDGNKENKTPEQQEQEQQQQQQQQQQQLQQEASSKEDSNDEPAQIIPWRAQLRKTNSKLSLIE